MSTAVGTCCCGAAGCIICSPPTTLYLYIFFEEWFLVTNNGLSFNKYRSDIVALAALPIACTYNAAANRWQSATLANGLSFTLDFASDSACASATSLNYCTFRLHTFCSAVSIDSVCGAASSIACPSGDVADAGLTINNPCISCQGNVEWRFGGDPSCGRDANSCFTRDTHVAPDSFNGLYLSAVVLTAPGQVIRDCCCSGTFAVPFTLRASVAAPGSVLDGKTITLHYRLFGWCGGVNIEEWGEWEGYLEFSDGVSNYIVSICLSCDKFSTPANSYNIYLNGQKRGTFADASLSGAGTTLNSCSPFSVTSTNPLNSFGAGSFACTISITV